MRRVEVHGVLFVVPTRWTYWVSADWRFQQRPDGSIWIQRATLPWRCVSPSIMPAERRSA